MEAHPDPNEDPMLTPPVPYKPEDFGFYPDLLEDHKAFIDSTLGDQTLFLLMEMARSLEHLRGTPAEPADFETQLQSFNDRIAFRRAFLGGS